MVFLLYEIWVGEWSPKTPSGSSRVHLQYFLGQPGVKLRMQCYSGPVVSGITVSPKQHWGSTATPVVFREPPGLTTWFSEKICSNENQTPIGGMFTLKYLFMLSLKCLLILCCINNNLFINVKRLFSICLKNIFSSETLSKYKLPVQSCLSSGNLHKIAKPLLHLQVKINELKNSSSKIFWEQKEYRIKVLFLHVANLG